MPKLGTGPWTVVGGVVILFFYASCCENGFLKTSEKSTCVKAYMLLVQGIIPKVL